MRLTSLLALAFAALPLGASAASLTLDTAVTFDSVAGGAAVRGLGTGSASWGIGRHGQSGHSFAASRAVIDGEFEDFLIGEFKLTNRSVWNGTAATGARFTLTASGTFRGEAFTFSDLGSTTQAETLDRPCGRGGCQDTMTVRGINRFETAVADDEGIWGLSIFLRETSCTAPEQGGCTVGLYASVDNFLPASPTPVPLPAGLSLLGTALGGFGALAWLKRRSARRSTLKALPYGGFEDLHREMRAMPGALLLDGSPGLARDGR